MEQRCLIPVAPESMPKCSDLPQNKAKGASLPCRPVHRAMAKPMATVKGTMASWSDVVNACADCNAIVAVDWGLRTGDWNSNSDWQCDVLGSDTYTYVCTPLVSSKYLPQWYLHVYLRWAHTLFAAAHTHSCKRRWVVYACVATSFWLSGSLDWDRLGPVRTALGHCIACCGESSAAKVRMCQAHTLRLSDGEHFSDKQTQVTQQAIKLLYIPFYGEETTK